MLDELIDILDEDGKPTGGTTTKAEALQHGWWRGTVWGILYDPKQKKILLQKRVPTKKLYPGCWDLSYTGGIQAGENAEKAALRECSEELGIDILSGNLLLLGTFKDSVIFSDMLSNEFVSVFLSEMDFASPLEFNALEISEVGFFTLEEAQENLRNTYADFEASYGRVFTWLEKKIS